MFHRLNIYFLLMAMLAATSVFAEYEDFVKYQKIIRLDGKTNSSSIASEAQRLNLKIVHQDKDFVIVRPGLDFVPVEFEKSIKQIKKIKGVLKIENEKILYAQAADGCKASSANGESCLSEAQVSNTNDILAILNKVDCSNGCLLRPLDCKGKNPAWAKQQIGADLAEAFVVEALKGVDTKKNYANVTVIDTGFDIKRSNVIKPLGDFKLSKGHDAAGNPEGDEVGHGTAVASMISGKDIGITSHINLEIMRVTEPGAREKVDNGLLEAAILKACETADIVNISWGSKEDEKDEKAYEKLDWYKQAQRKGCLIIKSSGNRGVKRDHPPEIALDSPIITSGSVGNWKTESGFSTTAQLMAPGEGVYTYQSGQLIYEDYIQKQSCDNNGDPIGPTSGTSFSSPANSGVAGQVVTVLKARGTLPKDPLAKIKLVKSILFASSKIPNGQPSEDATNALAAVNIAALVTKNNQNLNVAGLLTLYKNKLPSLCSDKKMFHCEDMSACDDKRACIDQFKSKMFLCPNLDSEELKNLLEENVVNHLCLNEVESGLSNLSLFSSEVIHKESNLIEDFLKAMWKRREEKNPFGRPFIGPTSFAFGLFAKAEEIGVGKEFLTADKLVGIFNDISFSSPGSSYSDMDSSPKLVRAEENFKKMLGLVKKLAPSEFENFIAKIPEYTGHVTYSDFYLEAELNFLAYLVKKGNLDSAQMDIVLKKINQVSDDWTQGKFKLEVPGEKEKSTIYELVTNRALSILTDEEKKSITITKNPQVLSLVYLAPQLFPDVTPEKLSNEIIKIHPEEPVAQLALARLLKSEKISSESIETIQNYYFNHLDGVIPEGILADKWTVGFNKFKQDIFSDTTYTLKMLSEVIKKLSAIDSFKEGNNSKVKQLLNLVFRLGLRLKDAKPEDIASANQIVEGYLAKLRVDIRKTKGKPELSEKLALSFILQRLDFDEDIFQTCLKSSLTKFSKEMFVEVSKKGFLGLFDDYSFDIRYHLENMAGR